MGAQLAAIECARGKRRDRFVHAVLHAQGHTRADSLGIFSRELLVQALELAEKRGGEALRPSLFAEDQRWQLLFIADQDKAPGEAQRAQDGGNGKLSRL